MSKLGAVKDEPRALIHLACGHAVRFAPPYPRRFDELTCGTCGEPTEVR
jgi:hypothetical protein